MLVSPAIFQVVQAVLRQPKMVVGTRFTLEEITVNAGKGSNGLPDHLSGVFFLDGNYIAGTPSVQLMDTTECKWKKENRELSCCTDEPPKGAIWLDGVRGSAGGGPAVEFAPTCYIFIFEDDTLTKATMLGKWGGFLMSRATYYFDLMPDPSAALGDVWIRRSCIKGFFGVAWWKELIASLWMPREPYPNPLGDDITDVPDGGHPECTFYKMRRLVHRGKLNEVAATRFKEVWPIGKSNTDPRCARCASSGQWNGTMFQYKVAPSEREL